MLYFAYGSNMDPGQMRRRCPGAVALGAAVLREHRLTFTFDSPRWGGGVGHVEHAPGDDVWGVLWDLAEPHLRSLDRYERVDKGVYERATVTVEFEGRECEVTTYRCTHAEYKRPSTRYVRSLLRGAAAYGLPDGYVRGLEALLG